MVEYACIKKREIKMKKFKCIVLDHDDTSVKSTPEIHYPSFLETLDVLRPGTTYSYDEFIKLVSDPGFYKLCREICGFDDEEMKVEYRLWREYVRTHTPDFYDGIPQFIERLKADGVLICVVSHSLSEMIVRDYNHSNVPLPDMIFGAEYPEEQQKPSVYPLKKIMETYSLSPDDILVIDDLKPGYEMAKKVGVHFAYAGWAATRLPEIDEFMNSHGVPILSLEDLKSSMLPSDIEK